MARSRRCAGSACMSRRARSWRLLGANGAGKSTTLRTISGLGPPAHRRDPLPRPAHRRLAAVAHRAARRRAFARRARRVFGSLTVAENLRLGAAARADRSGIDDDRDRVYRPLSPILRERSRQQAATLSGGEQQMLALARALMARPQAPPPRRALARPRADHRAARSSPALAELKQAGVDHAAGRAEHVRGARPRRPRLCAAHGRGAPRRRCARAKRRTTKQVAARLSRGASQ